MSGFPVYHQLPELAQTHVHRVGDAIQPSHPKLTSHVNCYTLLIGKLPRKTFVYDGFYQDLLLLYLV